MRITDFVRADAVIHRLAARDRLGALAELAAVAARLDPALDASTVLDVLEAREQLGSTGVGEGVAIPHGRVPRLRSLVGVLALSEVGIDVDAPDRLPARVLVALLVPEHGHGGHLEAMAAISRLFRDEPFRRKLLQAVDAAEVHRLLVEAEAGLGARRRLSST